MAGLVPADAGGVAALVNSDDSTLRRMVTAFAVSRGQRAHAVALLPGLEDADPQVRLYTDRALRGLTGKNVGYDYLADVAARAAAIKKWRALVSE